jgi:DNA-binding FadR family transcriptional regulator
MEPARAAGRTTGRARPRRRRAKAATLLAQQLVREIHRRGLKPGDKLLSEQKMVERYAVARGSLREALRYLELQGVLRIKSGPGGGPVIETPNGHHFASTLALMLQCVGGRFRSIVETRWLVEPGIAALAAERATADDLRALRASLEVMRAVLDDPVRFQDENRRFHDLLAFASRNPVARFLLPALHRISDGAGIAYSAEERGRILRAMRRILTAIEAGDGQAAYDTMRRFFALSLEYLDRTYPDVMARPLEWASVEG